LVNDFSILGHELTSFAPYSHPSLWLFVNISRGSRIFLEKSK